jgi:hypothetical protein
MLLEGNCATKPYRIAKSFFDNLCPKFTYKRPYAICVIGFIASCLRIAWI